MEEGTTDCTRARLHPKKLAAQTTSFVLQNLIPPHPSTLVPHISPPFSPHKFIMADVYVAQKIAAVLPPPAFGDIAKSSNDVRFAPGPQSPQTTQLLTRCAAHQQGLLPRCCRSGASSNGASRLLTAMQLSSRSSSRPLTVSTSLPRAPRRMMVPSPPRYVPTYTRHCRS